LSNKRSLPKALRAALAFGVAGYIANPVLVRLWWNFIDYDGDMPFGVIVVLQHISLLLLGVIPFGVALIVAVIRRRLDPIPRFTLTSYALGAGICWKGLPLILGKILPDFAGSFHWIGLGVWIGLLSGIYFALIFGLAHVRYTLQAA
jgi:hypothetical protein